MWEPSSLTEKKFNAETHRLVGETQLHEFGEFIKKFTHETKETQKKFNNIFNISSKPIFLSEEVNESISILHLSHSDNKTLSKILCTLGAICQEIELLKGEAKDLYQPFIIYVEDKDENLETISNIIEPLLKIQNFVNRSNQVINLVLKQLSSILKKGFYISNTAPSFVEVLSLFADLLICLLKFTTILDQQVFKEKWLYYRRILRNMLHNNKYNFNVEELRSLDKTLAVLESTLLSGTILKDSIDKCLESKLILDIKNSSLNLEFQNFILYRINELEKEEDIRYEEMWLQLNVIMAFFCNIFGNNDKKIIKRLLDLNKKISACPLIGHIMWYPEQFLLKHVQSMAKYLDEKNIESYRLNYINTTVQNFPKDTNFFCLQACYFLIDLEKKIKINTTTLKQTQLQDISILFFDILKVLKQINYAVTWTMNIHVDKMLPITKTILTCVSHLIEVLKSVYLAFRKNMLLVCYLILLISQQLQHKALSILVSLKRNQTQDKSYKNLQLDIISALNVCENALKGPNTKWRILTVNLALSASGLSATSLSDIRQVLVELDIISRYTTLIEQFCNCSFLYWHFNYMLPVYCTKLLSSKPNIARHSLMLEALSDSEIPDGVINVILTSRLYNPVNQRIETNLRLQTHLHLQLPPSDPFQNYSAMNFQKYMLAPLNDYYKSIKNETEHYLSTMFYNLTTVVLHDWKTYGEMRKLANFQYGLETVDDDLPMQTLDQGLDVLEIMRNINVFVQKYLYNLNTQVFIEESSNNKHLNSINISHVANSIRTHGIGIMNTTVNYTYQFLKNKFRMFSQFLFDEQIKSRLLKDLRYFLDHKDEFNQMYPYEQADKFNTGIRKLGTPDGESYLDLFRKVITHIGSAMGYVRLVRSGGNRCLAEGTCFIPDLTRVKELKEMVENENLSDMSKEAVDFLINNLEGLTGNFENTTEYFQLLVKGYAPHFRNPNNIHLKNFYVIVPALTINFVEHLLSCKERLFKKNQANGAFTDDGFALGLAYIIELLDQENRLNSLHWFESVQRKFNKELLLVKEQISSSNNDDNKLKQTLSLTEKRINSFKKEFKLLEYSYSSARLFFQT